MSNSDSSFGGIHLCGKRQVALGTMFECAVSSIRRRCHAVTQYLLSDEITSSAGGLKNGGTNPMYLGRRVRPFGENHRTFNHGGPSYVLNRASLITLASHLDDDACHPHAKKSSEDVLVRQYSVRFEIIAFFRSFVPIILGSTFSSWWCHSARLTRFTVRGYKKLSSHTEILFLCFPHRPPAMLPYSLVYFIELHSFVFRQEWIT